jgi:D-glycero-D-manno-heptose 1,7-bisphosphate phosphatase
MLRLHNPGEYVAPTIFLDRDGVINENRTDHVKSWGEFRFIPGALHALRTLTQAGVRIFVVTNQAIINRGVVDRAVVDDIHARMVAVAAQHDAIISAVRCCPHRPDEWCGCRKPHPGMLLGLAEEYGVDLDQAVMVGDALTDIAAGKAAGCRTVLVRTGRGAAQLALPEARLYRPNAVARDLADAVDWYIAQEHLALPIPGMLVERAVGSTTTAFPDRCM